jgi:hypothetical protein
MKTKPYIVNIENISKEDLSIILFDLTKKKLDLFEFDNFGNLIFDKKIKITCGNNDISFKDFYGIFSNEGSVIVSEIKIISSNNNQQNQEYSYVRTKGKSIQQAIINEQTSDFVLNNEIYLKVGCFLKDTIITILFYPK